MGAEKHHTPEDLRPILSELAGEKDAAAHFLLHHTIGALRASTSDPLSDAEIQHFWSTVAAELAVQLDDKTEYAVRVLLAELSERHESIGDAALVPFGFASRLYLAYGGHHSRKVGVGSSSLPVGLVYGACFGVAGGGLMGEPAPPMLGSGVRVSPSAWSLVFGFHRSPALFRVSTSALKPASKPSAPRISAAMPRPLLAPLLLVDSAAGTGAGADVD